MIKNQKTAAMEQFEAIREAMNEPGTVCYTDMTDISVIEQDDSYEPLAFIDRRTEHDLENHLYHVRPLYHTAGEGYAYVCPLCCNIHTVFDDEFTEGIAIYPGCESPLPGEEGTARYFTDGGETVKLPLMEKIILHTELGSDQGSEAVNPV